MKNPFFSIITCTKNSEKFIAKNIDSVNVQTFRSYEHIFIDGESSDRTKELIKKTIKNDSLRNRLYIFPPTGISSAFNDGVKKSKGEYLIFLNSDDYFYDNKVLEDACDFLHRNEKPDWVYGMINVIEENGRNIGVFPKFALFKYRFPCLLKFINYIPHQAVFINKESFEKFGLFDINLSSIMDYDYWLRIADKTDWKHFNRIVSNYTIRKGAKSSSKKNIHENHLNLNIVLKRHLNSAEFIIASVVGLLVDKLNKVLR